MSPNEQFYNTCKVFNEQVKLIESHIKANKLYSSFDFSKLDSTLEDYKVWAQANSRVIEAALKPAPQAANA